MSGWIKIEDRKPKDDENIRAYGTWCGEIHGEGSKVTGEGPYNSGCNLISLDSDSYSTEVINITHWHPLIDPPTE